MKRQQAQQKLSQFSELELFGEKEIKKLERESQAITPSSSHNWDCQASSSSGIQQLTKNDLVKALNDISFKKKSGGGATAAAAGASCNSCQYKFGESNDGKSIKNPLSYLRRRKPVKCNRCQLHFCRSCCDNLYYAEGFRDQKVPMCDNCYETEIKIRSKKIRVAYKDSVFLADFAETQVQKIYEEYFRK